MLRVKRQGTTTVVTLTRDVNNHADNAVLLQEFGRLEVHGNFVVNLGGKRLHRDNRGPLVHLNRRVCAAGHKLVICNVNALFMRHIVRGGLAGLLVITQDEESAHDQLAA